MMGSTPDAFGRLLMSAYAASGRSVVDIAAHARVESSAVRRRLVYGARERTTLDVLLLYSAAIGTDPARLVAIERAETLGGVVPPMRPWPDTVPAIQHDQARGAADSVVARLHERRTSTTISIRDMARRLRVAHPTVVLLESGKRRAAVRTLVRYAYEVGVTLDAIIEHTLMEAAP